jgi:hypothetical protein
MSESGYLHWSYDPFEKMVIIPLDPLLLSTENVLIVFLPQVTLFPPGKLSAVHEIQVGLSGRDFSRDFVCSLTHSHNEATSCGFINFLSLLSSL